MKGSNKNQEFYKHVIKMQKIFNLFLGILKLEF